MIRFFWLLEQNAGFKFRSVLLADPSKFEFLFVGHESNRQRDDERVALKVVVEMNAGIKLLGTL